MDIDPTRSAFSHLSVSCIVLKAWFPYDRISRRSIAETGSGTQRGQFCAKWKHFLSDVSDVADQTRTVRGCIERVEMSLKPGFHMIVTVIVSICRRLIGDASPMYRSRLPTVTIIWKPGLTLVNTLIPGAFAQGMQHFFAYLKRN